MIKFIVTKILWLIPNSICYAWYDYVGSRLWIHALKSKYFSIDIGCKFFNNKKSQVIDRFSIKIFKKYISIIP